MFLFMEAIHFCFQKEIEFLVQPQKKRVEDYEKKTFFFNFAWKFLPFRVAI